MLFLKDNSLRSAQEERLDPVTSSTSDTVPGDPLQQAFMTNFVKGLVEVHHQDVRLVALIIVCTKVVVEFQQLSLAGEFAAESMLEVIEYVMSVIVVHNVLYHTALEELAADTSQTDRSVVLCKRLLPLLVCRYHICLAPLIRTHTRAI